MSKSLVRVFLSLFAIYFFTIPCFALPLPDENFTRQQAIDTYFKDKTENLLEGIWITEDNQYEIAIVKNDFSICQGYNYIGFIVQTTDSAWQLGNVKLQLKTTAVPKLFVGLWHKSQNGYQSPAEEHSVGSVFRISPNNKNILEYLTEKKERKALIRIYPDNTDDTYTHLGTGFFIAPDLIVTNYHVIADCETISIKYSNDLSASATIAAKDPVNDLALLKVAKAEPSIIPLSLADIQNCKESDPVYTLGYPLSDILGTNAKLGQGIINSLSGIKDDIRMFQISIPIQPGNSGGPLINAKGQVVGVVSGTLNPFVSNTIPQNVNFAMKINYLNNLLAMLPNKIPPSVQKPANDLTPAQISILAKNAVARVQAK
ncbi:MAG: serine protease [Pelosinus sp.]|nr:serine protease [Pelosinus sp.]